MAWCPSIDPCRADHSSLRGGGDLEMVVAAVTDETDGPFYSTNLYPIP